jgi:hypothetical protein
MEVEIHIRGTWQTAVGTLITKPRNALETCNDRRVSQSNIIATQTQSRYSKDVEIQLALIAIRVVCDP